MTVQSTAVQTTAVANGGVTTFTYQFKLQEATDLVVQLIDLVGAVHGPLVLNSDYTVDPLGLNLDAGGNILNCTYLGVNIPNGWTVVMTREMALTQDTDLANQGTYLPESVETEFDAVVMMEQGHDFQLARTIHGLLTDAAMPALPPALQRLGMYLQFDPVTGMPNAVPGAPSVLKDNFAASSAPTSANDNTQGYSEGSSWFDTIHNTVYLCMSAATGAAVWVQLVVKNNLTAVVAPTTANDNTQGYSEGSSWFDTIHNTVYLCTNAATGAAVWVQLVVKNNLTAVVAPTTANDNTQGYSVNSVWLNTANNNFFICLSAATGAALWSLIYTPTPAGQVVNYFVDPCCRVAQIGTSSPPSLSTSRQYGVVDLVQCWGSGTAISAGTITQDATYTVAGAATAYSCKLAGCTITGTGKVFFRRWIESRNAIALKNNNALFSVLGFQDTGAALNAFLTINKATAQDNFASVTTIATGPTVSVPTSAATAIGSGIVAMGDCSNGIEIILEMDCGTVTTKDFYATDWQAAIGALAPVCQVPRFNDDLAGAQRYYETSYLYGTTPGTNTTQGFRSFVTTVSVNNNVVFAESSIPFKVRKIASPAISVWSTTGASGKIRYINGVSDFVANSAIYTSDCVLTVNNESGAASAASGSYQLHFVADARL